jgi:hypothetical protein
MLLASLTRSSTSRVQSAREKPTWRRLQISQWRDILASLELVTSMYETCRFIRELLLSCFLHAKAQLLTSHLSNTSGCVFTRGACWHCFHITSRVCVAEAVQNSYGWLVFRLRSLNISKTLQYEIVPRHSTQIQFRCQAATDRVFRDASLPLCGMACGLLTKELMAF